MNKREWLNKVIHKKSKDKDTNKKAEALLKRKLDIQKEMSKRDIESSINENRQNIEFNRQQSKFQKNMEEYKIIESDAQLKTIIAKENLREQKILENEQILQRNEAILDEQDAQIRKEKTSGAYEFNFYKLKEVMQDTSLTFVKALNKAGMVPNVYYNLDYENNKICRIHNRNSDDICKNLKQNKVVAKLIKDEKAITCLVGKPYETEFEIGLLVYDIDFGVILFTRYKDYNKYIFDVGKRLQKSGLIGNGKRVDVKLSKSFVKVAFNSAIRIDLDRGITNEDDMNAYTEMCEYNKIAEEKISHLLHAIGVNQRRLLK